MVGYGFRPYGVQTPLGQSFRQQSSSASDRICALDVIWLCLVLGFGFPPSACRTGSIMEPHSLCRLVDHYKEFCRMELGVLTGRGMQYLALKEMDAEMLRCTAPPDEGECTFQLCLEARSSQRRARMCMAVSTVQSIPWCHLCASTWCRKLICVLKGEGAHAAWTGMLRVVSHFDRDRSSQRPARQCVTALKVQSIAVCCSHGRDAPVADRFSSGRGAATVWQRQPSVHGLVFAAALGQMLRFFAESWRKPNTVGFSNVRFHRLS